MTDKCDTVLTTKVPEDMADLWKRRARLAGCTPGELLRDLVSVTLHGMTFGELETNDRRKALGLQELARPPMGSCNSAQVLQQD